MTLEDFVFHNGFDPMKNPNVTIDQSDGAARDTITIATREGKFISIDGWGQVFIGWKHVNIVHRCFTHKKVIL